MSVPVPAEKLETARRMLDEGASYAEIGRALGITGQTVGRHFPGRGMQPSKILDYETIARLHRQGLSAAQIAVQVGCSPESVHRWRVAEGLSEPARENARRPATPERLAAAKVLLDDGASPEDAARTLRMNPGTLRRHFPHRVWTQEQSVRYALMVRQLNRLESFA